MRVILVILMALFLFGCDREPRKITYIETERGIVSYGSGNCELGLLLNNQMQNILDENSNPITCSGYIKLTWEEAEDYRKNNPHDLL